MPPPRKPSHLRAVEGNPSHSRPINHMEPKPDSGFLPAPDYFTAKEKIWYNEMCEQLVKFGVMSVMDSKAVEMMVSAYSTYRKAKDELDEHGSNTYKTLNSSGGITIKAHPSVAIASDAWRRFRSMATEFGLTPASRSKVVASEKNEDDIVDDLLNRKRS